jgi:hypothetical protein
MPWATVVKSVVKAPKRQRSGFSDYLLKAASLQDFQRAGGTGIEPATCGFGALGAVSRIV